MPRLTPALFCCAVAVFLTACSSSPFRLDQAKRHVAREGEFWQRTAPSDVAMMQGPKAQQILNRHLASCASELSELVRLGQIKTVIPANRADMTSADSAALAALRAWDTPERDGMLRTETPSYTDMDTCMMAKGWERVAYLPHDTIGRGAVAYVENHRDYKKWRQNTFNPSGQEPRGDFDRLND